MEIFSLAVWYPSHQPVVESQSAVPVLLFLALAALLWVAHRAG